MKVLEVFGPPPTAPIATPASRTLNRKGVVGLPQAHPVVLVMLLSMAKEYISEVSVFKPWLSDPASFLWLFFDDG